MTRTPSRIFIVALAAVLGLLGPISAHGQRIPGQGLLTSWDQAAARYRNDVLKEIRPRLERWQAAWNEGEFDELADLYDDDARLFFGPELVVGKEGIRQYFEEIGNSVAGISISLSDFYVSDRLAFLMGTYSYQVGKDGRLGERVESVYVASFVGHGRSWRIRTQVFRVPFPGTS
jgi:ketosteroid isomerase-like protein